MHSYARESPVPPHSPSWSEEMSDDTIYLDDIASPLSAPSPLIPKQHFYHIQRHSALGTDVDLTITEPSHIDQYALHLGPRFSFAPGAPEVVSVLPPQATRDFAFRQLTRQPASSHDVQATHCEEPHDSAIEHIHKLWTPWSLRRSTLLALMLFFMACIVVLELLSLLSTRDDGLGKGVESSRFIWICLPPTLFFVIASIWDQVEYRTKQLMPWRTMAAAPASASHSLLLNYITPLNIVAFIQSISMGHPGVATSIAAGVVLKVLVIVSPLIMSLQDENLKVQLLPLRLMEALLGLLVFLTAAMLWSRPAPATPNDTSTIFGLAAVLSNSSSYADSLHGLATASSQKLEAELYKHQYQTNIGYRGNEPYFRLSLAAGESKASASLISDSSELTIPEKWWSPIHDLTRLVILSCSLGVLVVVELLHQQSQKNGGLAATSEPSALRYVWQVVPATVALFMMMLVGLIDHATKLVQPYYSLKRGNQPARTTLQTNYLSQLAPLAMINALRNRHFGVAVSGLAVLFAQFLTIMSAGLFYPSSIEVDAATNIDAVIHGAGIVTNDATMLQTRMVQDTVSTRIVEGLLGAIFLTAAIASLITETLQVLPYNPCSIARMSSLIAESNLIDSLVPSGSEWATNKSIDKTGICDQFHFSLGFFEKSRRWHWREKVFGIDVGDAETL